MGETELMAKLMFLQHVAVTLLKSTWLAKEVGHKMQSVKPSEMRVLLVLVKIATNFSEEYIPQLCIMT